MLKLLEKVDADTARRLRRRLGKALRSGSVRSDAFIALIQDLRDQRASGIVGTMSEMRGELREFAKLEVEFEGRMIQAAVPVNVSLGYPAAERLGAIITSEPFQGHLLKDWTKSLVRADRERLEQAINLGMAQGEGVDTIVRRVVGTRRAGYTDGVLSVTRRQAEAVVRTAINHVSNSAREEVWEENEEMIAALRWEATLDGRTSAICQARDGALAPVGDKPLPAGARKLQPPDARPPAHINCRSVMVAVLDGDADIFAGLNRQSAVGPVPQEVTYGEWLGRQSAQFQDEVLGRSKGALFRKGGVTLDKFVDRRGNEMSLSDLRRTMPDAFKAAGL